MHAAFNVGTWLRALLWILVLVAPGGVLLVPLLAADAVRVRARTALARRQPS